MRNRLFLLFLWLVATGLGLYIFLSNHPIPTLREQAPRETRILEETAAPAEGGLSLTGPSPAPNTVLVTRVIDGDTIEITGSRKVRYIGIDTPETVDPGKDTQCFGLEAKKENEKLVLGKEVKVEKDISETDKYGRLLRYLWVGNIFVNDFLVRQGYARASSYPPDIKYQNQFREAEKEAREAGRGLWAQTPVGENPRCSI